MVAREGDYYSLVESFVVHLLLVGLARPCYYRKHNLPVFSLVITLENRRQSLPKLELEDLSSLLHTPII
jgi:L-cystine uptake protein TcyP (sodium:dicarboxylate symporter family)